MAKLTAFFYMSVDSGTERDPSYGDALLSGELEFKPRIGELFLLESFLSGDPLFVEIDHIVTITDKLIHVYCSEIKPDFLSNPPYFALKGNKKTIVAHALDQMRDFPKRYGVKDANYLKDLIEKEIKQQELEAKKK
jgi:hypothetical protein